MSVRTFSQPQAAIPQQKAYSGDSTKQPGARAQRRFEARKIQSSGPIPRNLDVMRPMIMGLLLVIGIMLLGGLAAALQ